MRRSLARTEMSSEAVWMVISRHLADAYKSTVLSTFSNFVSNVIKARRYNTKARLSAFFHLIKILEISLHEWSYVCARDLLGCSNGYNPAGFHRNPAGVKTEIKKKPVVSTVTGMIFAVIPQRRDHILRGILQVYLTIIVKIFLHSFQS